MTAPGSILVVGAGLAGARCAETLRAEGYEGDLVLVGDEPVAPYERPSLSKDFLAGERELDDLKLRPDSFWGDQGIELRLGCRIASVDTDAGTATTADGEELCWDTLVLATGAAPRRLPFAAPPGVHVLRTAADALGLQHELVPDAKLVIVGGGFVGAEVASTASKLGVEVSMLDRGLVPFQRALGPAIGRMLAHRYRAHGIDVHVASGATGFRTGADGRLSGVVLTDGRELECDVALVAIGVEQTRELCRWEPEPPVYACGDVAGSLGHWTRTASEAIGVARQILGLDPLPEQPPFFWSDQFGLRLQLVGHPHGADRVEVEGSDDEFVARYLAEDGSLLAALAANRPAEVGKLRKELALAA